MAIIYLKSGRSEADKASDDLRIRATVEATLTKIEREGDAGVRALSLQFDNFELPDFRLSPSEIAALMQKVSTRDMDDIKFAQTQIRRFAQAQRATMTDV